MRLADAYAVLPLALGTFSITIASGLAATAIAAKASVSVALTDSSRLPAVEKSWHGGPPMTTEGSDSLTSMPRLIKHK